jgi:hypothetical protein
MFESEEIGWYFLLAFVLFFIGDRYWYIKYVKKFESNVLRINREYNTNFFSKDHMVFTMLFDQESRKILYVDNIRSVYQVKEFSFIKDWVVTWEEHCKNGVKYLNKSLSV